MVDFEPTSRSRVGPAPGARREVDAPEGPSAFAAALSSGKADFKIEHIDFDRDGADLKVLVPGANGSGQRTVALEMEVRPDGQVFVGDGKTEHKATQEELKALAPVLQHYKEHQSWLTSKKDRADAEKIRSLHTHVNALVETQDRPASKVRPLPLVANPHLADHSDPKIRAQAAAALGLPADASQKDVDGAWDRVVDAIDRGLAWDTAINAILRQEVKVADQRLADQLEDNRREDVEKSVRRRADQQRRVNDQNRQVGDRLAAESAGVGGAATPAVVTRKVAQAGEAVSVGLRSSASEGEIREARRKPRDPEG